MTSGLRDRAAGRGPQPPAGSQPIDDRGTVDVASMATDYGEDYALPEVRHLVETPVYVLWAHLMRDVRYVKRSSNLPVQGKTIKFRGVNETIAAMSNALRRYGLFIAPVRAEITMHDGATGKGTKMREAVAVVTYAVKGPAGDSFEFVGVGQAADTGDRAVTKAERIAWRNGILDLLTASTGMPDAEETEFDRGEPRVTPEQYRAEILTARPERILQIHKEIGEAGGLDYMTTNGYDEPTTFRELIRFVGTARKDGRDPYPPRNEQADEPAPTEGDQ